MNRVKTMFIAIIILGGAAATLAVKARYNTYFCTTAATTTLVSGQQIYTCTYTLPGGQQSTLFCTNLVLRKLTAPHVPTVTVCPTAPTTIDGEITCAERCCGTPTTKLTLE